MDKPTSLSQQRQPPSGQWAHPSSSVLHTNGLTHRLQSGMPASVNAAQASWGTPDGSDKNPLHTSRPDVSRSTCSQSVSPQLQSHSAAMPLPAHSLNAAPATSSWAVSHPSSPSFPPWPPTQAPYPAPTASHPSSTGLPLRTPSQVPHQGPPAFHPSSGQHSSTLAPASRPASYCDHPLYAHLDLSRPLCLQQPPVFGHPRILTSPYVAEDQPGLPQPPTSGYPGSSESHQRSASPFVAEAQRPSLQQHLGSSVADVRRLQHQPLHEDKQQAFRRSRLEALQAQHQGQGPSLAACYPEQLGCQLQSPSTTVDPVSRNTVPATLGWRPRGETQLQSLNILNSIQTHAALTEVVVLQQAATRKKRPDAALTARFTFFPQSCEYMNNNRLLIFVLSFIFTINKALQISHLCCRQRDDPCQCVELRCYACHPA